MTPPSATPDPDAWTLDTFQGQPELRRAGDKPGHGVTADWKSLRLPTGAAALRRQPLGRAAGPDVRTAVDATAGLGFDAYALALLGVEVLALERDASVFALLRSQWVRACDDPGMSAAARRIRVEHADARQRLRSLTDRPQLILLDPMFGGPRGAAKPSKAMQALAATVGTDDDADELLDIALAAATRRVIVKRSLRAPPLAGREPDWSVRGKLLRFDAYRCGG